MQTIGYKRTVQNCVHIVLRTVRTRVIYDRVQNKKNNFEITAFLNYEEELQEREIQNQMKTKTRFFFNLML